MPTGGPRFTTPTGVCHGARFTTPTGGGQQLVGPDPPHQLVGPDSPHQLVELDSPHQLVGPDSPHQLVEPPDTPHQLVRVNNWWGQFHHTNWETNPHQLGECSDITNTLVGISGETATVVRISMFIVCTVLPPVKRWFKFTAGVSHHTPPPPGGLASAN